MTQFTVKRDTSNQCFYFRAFLYALTLGILLTSCSSSSDDDTSSEEGNDSGTDSGMQDKDTGNTEDSGASENNNDKDTGNTEETTEQAIGAFQVSLVAPKPATETSAEKAGYTSVVGKVYDGPTPLQIVWEKNAEEGDCVLLKPRVPFCSTACGGSAVCVEDDTCQDYPTAQTVGTVHVTGLHTTTSENEFSMDPIANTYQPTGDVSLAYPAFSEGEEIKFEASGSDFTTAFSLEAKGIAPLELLNDSIPLKKDNAVTLTWTSPTQTDISTIYVKLDISHHGGTKGMIECSTQDDGTLELSATLLNKLLDLGVAGFPTIVVRRFSTGSTNINAGRVDLTISSEVETAVEVEGLSSCNEDSDCPEGQTCQTDLSCK